MSRGDIGRHVKALEGNAGEAAAAAKALGRLAYDNDANRAAIADAGAIAPLVALVTNGSADGQKQAALHRVALPQTSLRGALGRWSRSALGAWALE